MSRLNRVICFFLLIASTAGVNEANAWHGWGHHGWGHHGLGWGHHHHFRPSIYYSGWSSYSRFSFYGGYNLGYASYGPPIYSAGYWPSYYYAPVYYTPYVAPVIYSNFYYGVPTCSVTPASVTPALTSSLPLAKYTAKKPITSSVPFRVANQPAQQSRATRYLLTGASSTSPVVTSTTALDSTPDELLKVADAILAAGGYRQAAQAYAQLVVKYGNSDRLVTRRFIAQVANGDLEQAAVVIELALANGNQLDRSDLPQSDLRAALGDKTGLIGRRIEGLSASALQKPEDALPMLTVANWLALSGDDDRANLFKAHAEQMRQIDVGLLVRTSNVSSATAAN